MRMHRMEIPDSDGEVGSTAKAEDWKAFIEAEIQRLRALDSEDNQMTKRDAI